MVAFSRLNVGDILFDCRRQKMGNTTMSQMATWKVRIISLDSVRQTAVVSWNGNPPCIYGEQGLRRLRRTPVKGRK